MKNFIMPVVATILLVFTSCARDFRDEANLAAEISAKLSESLKSLGDSTFNNVVITSVDDSSDSDSINVVTSGFTADDRGNLYVSISANNDSDYPDEWWVSIVAITATALIFSGPILVVFIVCFFIYKSKRDRNRVIMESLATGRPLPDRFYNIPDRKPRLQPAVNYLAWSAGFFAFFLIRDKTSMAMLTLIPFIIGIGKLATYIIATRKSGNTDNNSDTPTTFCDNVE